MKQKYYSPKHEEISKALDELSELKKIWFNITKTNFNFTK